MTDDALLEAYDRLAGYGPEWGSDRLTNHGPMAVEVLARRGRSDGVERWVDRYVRRLESLPAPTDRITASDWAHALGDGRRLGDWVAFFDVELAEAPWREVLLRWWPRLLPGIAAGTSHGLIRTAHAVRALQRAPAPEAVTELGRALAFWAARSLAVPAVRPPAGTLDAATVLARLPRPSPQAGQVRDRFAALGAMPQWAAALGELRGGDAADVLADLVTAATIAYRQSGPDAPVLLVHTATAPNAVLAVLPELPEPLWQPSVAAVWALSAAITSGWAKPRPLTDPDAEPPSPEELLDRAVRHGDEHVVKFVDCAVDAYARSGNDRVLAAAATIDQLIEPPG